MIQFVANNLLMILLLIAGIIGAVVWTVCEVQIVLLEKQEDELDELN